MNEPEPSAPPFRRRPTNVPAWVPLLVPVVIMAATAAAGAINAKLQSFPPDPRPQVQGFVGAVGSGVLTDGDRAALSAYRITLGPREREALAHEVNYLLFRGGRPERFAFDAAGRVVRVAPEPPEPTGPSALAGKAGAQPPTPLHGPEAAGSAGPPAWPAPRKKDGPAPSPRKKGE